MVKKHKRSRHALIDGLFRFVVVCCVISGVSMAVLTAAQLSSPRSSVLSATSSAYQETVSLPVISIMTQDGNRAVVYSPSDTFTWIGTLSGPKTSYLGLLFDRSSLPAGAIVTNAKLQFTAAVGSRVPLKLEIRGIIDPNLRMFAESTVFSTLAQTQTKKDLSINATWVQGARYSMDVTTLAKEFLQNASTSAGLSIRGIGNRYAFRNISVDSENAPTLVVSYVPVSTSSLGLTGDCNGDTKIDAGDLSALSLEIADLDGSTKERVHNSTYQGYQGCDANGDGVVSSADRACISNLMFGKSCN